MRVLWFMKHIYAAVGVSILVIFIVLFQTPFHAPSESLVIIEEGTPLSEVAELLKERDVVVSKYILRGMVAFRGGATSIKAGAYTFDTPRNAFTVAGRLTQGDFGTDPIRVVFPEGTPSHGMSAILAGIIGTREAARFEREALAHEGYLFPDTYFVPPSATSGRLIALLTSTFEAKTAELVRQAEESGRAWSDVVIMASIVEKEARTYEDKRRVAGVLWKRLDDGMRLQVDAPFFYLFGKTSADITRIDLEMDSPFNTYRYAGLPPSPISNPGLETLEATLNPIESDYWFYLSDDVGTIHYAVTYDEHLDNKARYID